jgi:hypothetical protein
MSVAMRPRGKMTARVGTGSLEGGEAHSTSAARKGGVIAIPRMGVLPLTLVVMFTLVTSQIAIEGEERGRDRNVSSPLLIQQPGLT